MACRVVFAAVMLAAMAAGARAQSAPATRIHGTAVVAVADDFDNHTSETEYYVRDANSGNAQWIRFMDQAPADFRTGAMVTLTGNLVGQQLFVRSTDVNVEHRAPLTALERRQEAAQPANAPITFAQKTLVILLNFLDKNSPCTIDECGAHVFGPTNSVQSAYAETSYGHVTYTGTTVGPFTIDVSTTSSCPSPYLPTFEVWAGLADAQAQKAGIDLSGYTEKVYVLPGSDPCGKERGYATIGGSPGLAWIGVYQDPEVYTHEMGHNLGMAHARTLTDEYGDHSDIMGNTTIGIRDLDAPHRDQFNWLGGNLVNVAGSATYNIAPLELNPSQTSLPQALKIFKADTNEYYYFSYRQPSGYDAILPTFYSGLYTDGVSVHRFAGADANDVHTFFLQGLTDGTSFHDATNSITVTQVSHDSSGAQVKVSMGGPAAEVSSMSLSFADQAVNTPSTAQTISLTNTGSAALHITSIGITGANSGDFQVASNNCGANLVAGSSCAIAVDFAPVAAGTRSGFLSIADSAGIQEVSLSGSGAGAGPSADFRLTPQTATDTVNAGSSATYVVSVAGTSGFSGNVAVSCSVAAAAGTTCSATPASVAAGGQTTINVITTAHQAFLQTVPDHDEHRWQRSAPVLLVCLALAMVFMAAARVRRVRFAIAVPAAGLLCLMAFQGSGCASASVSKPASINPTPSPTSAMFGTQAGSYTVTITGTSGPDTHSVTVSLAVK